MGNTKQKLWKNILVIGILSAILLSGCGKENVPKEEPLMAAAVKVQWQKRQCAGRK